MLLAMLRMEFSTPAALCWLCRGASAIFPLSQKKKRKPKITQLLHEEARTRVLESELFAPLLHSLA